jgi:predicted phosphodiesterase
MIAILTDIHANREALTAALDDALRRKADQFVFLGDLVGYGADPGFVVDTVADYARRGAIVLRGNHDAAAAGADEDMNEIALQAIEWTRGRIDDAQRAFLSELPLFVEQDHRLYVHASAKAPGDWNYVSGPRAARESLEATDAGQTFCGHVHEPHLYCLSLTGKLIEHAPIAGADIPLLPGRRWLAVVGSTGQPRGGSAAAQYALLNEKNNTLTFHQIGYDAQSAANKILAAGLPAVLAERLLRG